MDTRTKVGQMFLCYSSRGQLVPDEISKVVSERRYRRVS